MRTFLQSSHLAVLANTKIIAVLKYLINKPVHLKLSAVNMLHLLKTVTCLLLIQYLYTVDALAIGGCVDRLTASLTNRSDTCLAMSNYVKCILLETNLYKTPNKDEDLRLFKTQFEKGLAEKGIICDIDVMAIAEELLEDDRKGIVHTTTRPTGYNNAKTIGECIDTFSREVGGGVTCASLTPYFKCIIRVTNVYALTSSITDQERQTLDQTVKDGLNKLNIDCDIKWDSLIDEVRREQNGENRSNPQQGNGENGAGVVVGSVPFVTLLILTCAWVFMLL